MSYRAYKLVFNNGVVQNRGDLIAIAFPNGDVKKFACDSVTQADAAAEHLREWLRAHLEDNGVKPDAN